MNPLDFLKLLKPKNFSAVRNFSLIRNLDLSKTLELFKDLSILKDFNGAQIEYAEHSLGNYSWRIINIINGKGDFIDLHLFNLKYDKLVDAISFLAGVLFCKKLILKPSFLFTDDDNSLILCETDYNRRILTFASPPLKKKKYGKKPVVIQSANGEVKILATNNPLEWWVEFGDKIFRDRSLMIANTSPEEEN